VDIVKKTSHKSYTAKYLGAYIKKPPISASRLTHYHGGEVSFTYLDHRTKTHKRKTLDQKEMVTRILSHVPEKHFKMIRYYGFLANRVRSSLLPLIYQQLKQERRRPFLPTFATMMKAKHRSFRIHFVRKPYGISRIHCRVKVVATGSLHQRYCLSEEVNSVCARIDLSEPC